MESLASGVESRFWSYVDKAGKEACWLWRGGLTSPGWHGKYNLVYADGERVSMTASRVAWLLTNGSVPQDLCVCHRCDNPRCVNPRHLCLMTREENTRDRDLKGRQARGSRVGSAELTESKVRYIKQRLRRGIYQWVLARQFGVSKSCIQHISSEKSWAWLT